MSIYAFQITEHIYLFSGLIKTEANMNIGLFAALLLAIIAINVVSGKYYFKLNPTRFAVQ